MITNKFNGFSIQYSEPITQDNYYKSYIQYTKDDSDYMITLMPQFFYLDMAIQLTSENEEEVLEGLRAYKWTVQNHLNNL